MSLKFQKRLVLRKQWLIIVKVANKIQVKFLWLLWWFERKWPPQAHREWHYLKELGHVALLG